MWCRRLWTPQSRPPHWRSAGTAGTWRCCRRRSSPTWRPWQYWWSCRQSGWCQMPLWPHLCRRFPERKQRGIISPWIRANRRLKTKVWHSLPIWFFVTGYVILHKDCAVCLKHNVQRQKLSNKDRNGRCSESRLKSDLLRSSSPKERKHFRYRGHDIDHILEHQPKQRAEQV